MDELADRLAAAAGAAIGGVNPFEGIAAFFGMECCCFCSLFSMCFPAIAPAESGTRVPKPFIAAIIASS